MHVNLLPPNTRLRIQFRCLLCRYVLCWSLAGLALAVHTVAQIKNIYEARCQLAELEERCRPVYALEESIAHDEHELILLRAHLDRLKDLEPSDHLLELLGVLGQATRSEAGKLYLQRITLQDAQPVPTSNPPVIAGQTKHATPQTLTTVSLSGVADDDVTLTQFISALRQSGIFEHVGLKASSQVAGSERLSRQYQLECRYEDGP